MEYVLVVIINKILNNKKTNMIKYTLSIFSLSDMLLGLKISHGHHEYMEDSSLVKFSRLEIGVIFFHFQITKYHEE
jgi:hypothetical protein